MNLNHLDPIAELDLPGPADAPDPDAVTAPSADAGESGAVPMAARPGDGAELFRVSGMCDALRDTAVAFTDGAVPVSDVTLAMLSDQYRTLRAVLFAGFDADTAAAGDPLVPRLDGTAPDVAWVQTAATLLSRWCDVVHGTPSFILSEKVAAANAHVLGLKVREALGDDPDEDPAPDGPVTVPGLHVGHYL